MCVVFTDNNPLSHLQTAKPGAWEQQWASQLAMIDLDLRYKPGKSNGNADVSTATDYQGTSSVNHITFTPKTEHPG